MSKPKILFSHQNFPAQFGHFGAYLAQNGWDVTYAAHTVNGIVPEGTKLFKTKPHREPAPQTHRYAQTLDKAMINGQGFANAAIKLRHQGFTPDIVVAHSGWGSGTFTKSVWPTAKFVAYVEWFYNWPAADVLPEDMDGNYEDASARALARNAPSLVDMATADQVWCPTEFQASQFPPHLRKLLKVVRDGVDTKVLSPDKNVTDAALDLELPTKAEIVTYATRGMEPQRGFPQFMEALAKLQRKRPKLHAIIAGTDRVAYGKQLPEGESWKQRMLDKLDLDLTRIHFTGALPRQKFTNLLQLSDVHVYLTVPFVLSWSLIEAMSCGATIVASDNASVGEMLADEKSALLVDHNKQRDLIGAINRLLDDRELAASLGKRARAKVVATQNQARLWPQKEKLLRDLIGRTE